MRSRVHPYGFDQAGAKLTYTDASKIRLLHRTTALSERDLARMFGVVVSTISAVITGQSWS